MQKCMRASGREESVALDPLYRKPGRPNGGGPVG